MRTTPAARRAAALVACLVAFAACGGDGSSSPLAETPEVENGDPVPSSPETTSSAVASQSGPTSSMPDEPIRAAFYYPWYPESWAQLGQFPYTNFQPALGAYDSADPAVIERHLEQMAYGHIDAAIASWWGERTQTDGRIPTLLAAAEGSGVQWALYYEVEGYGAPTEGRIRADLEYIRKQYAHHTTYLHVDERFVVFVWADEADDCEMAGRWDRANTVGAYVVLKVFDGFEQCTELADGWHQYGPAESVDDHLPWSFSVSPGFWKFDEAPRLERDLARWERDVRSMLAADAQWHLITSFNEWGEGTSIETAAEWGSPSGHGSYLDVLHENP